MEFRRLAEIILRKTWLIIILAIVSATVTYSYIRFAIKPVYSSHIKFIILHTERDRLIYDDFMVSNQLMRDYSEIIKSYSLLTEVISVLGNTTESVESLTKKIEVKLISDTEIMDVIISDNSPYQAQKYARALGNVFEKKVKPLSTENFVSYVDTANLPNKPDKAHGLLFSILAAILSVVVCISIIILNDTLDDLLMTFEEVENLYGLKVLGTIPDFKIKNKQLIRM